MEDCILSVLNRVIVSSQLDNGDSIDVSVKAIDRALSSKDRSELDSRIQQSIIPYLDDALYLRVRLTMGKTKSNWNKIKTVAELNKILDEIFSE